MGRKSAERRVNRIFDMLENNPELTAADVDAVFHRNERIERKRRKRADESEEKAFNLLLDIPYLEDLKKVSNQPNHDQVGHDIVARINQKEFFETFWEGTRLKEIFFQVKSSNIGVHMWKKKRGENPRTSRENLRQQKIAVVHPNCSEEDFQKQVKTEVRGIHEHYKWNNRYGD